MSLRLPYNLASMFADDDLVSLDIRATSIRVGYHDAAQRRTAADFLSLGGWAFNQANAIVSQSGTVNGVTIDLYSKADGDDWLRFHEVNGPLRQGGAA